MKQESDNSILLQELFAKIGQLLECDGITQLTKGNSVIQALVDEKTPVLINFVPNQQAKEDEYILQIYFSLGKLRTTKTSLLLERLEELNRHVTLGSLCFLSDLEIGYKHRMPIKVSTMNQAITNFECSMQLMLLFLLTYLPYVQILAEAPETITLARYLEEEG